MIPSDVRFDTSFPPLVATCGRTDREAALAMLVLACQHHGDRWQVITPKQIGEALKAVSEEMREPWVALSSNPFWRPDFYDLVREGYASGELTNGGGLTITEKALLALRESRHVAAQFTRKAGGSDGTP